MHLLPCVRERKVLRGPLWPARRALNLRTRRRKEQPGSFPMLIRRDGVEREVETPIADYLKTIPLPIFGPPGFLEDGAQLEVAAQGLDVDRIVHPQMPLHCHPFGSLNRVKHPEPIVPAPEQWIQRVEDEASCCCYVREPVRDDPSGR